ncbi:pyridoxal-phosphate dependent enzyme [Candidatus Dojkabacteria bacterium]|nr:pyridoxal-phosphate dependent enzyme [Candidatus Dojkabacteria bacterium]
MDKNSILGTIGNTPIIELRRYSFNKNVKIFAKLEGRNPGGSIKDRVAHQLVLSAETKGLISKNRDIKLIEATSGNTGIGLAMVSAIRGYKFLAVMPKNASTERKKLIKQFGADLLLTDGSKGSNFALKTAQEIVKNTPEKYIMLNQYNNPANPEAHFLTTGKEIQQQMPEITHFVAGMGTGGTLMGVGKRLKQFKKSIKVIGVEPAKGSKLQGLRNMEEFIPGVYKPALIDKKLIIADDSPALELVGDLARISGISVGFSSGAALWGARELSKSLKNGIIVTVFPDSGDRYLSLTPVV